MLTRDEARRIAANIAKLPDLLRQRVEPMPDDPEAMLEWGKRNMLGED